MKLSFWERRRLNLQGYSINANGHKIFNPTIYRFDGSDQDRIRFNILVVLYFFINCIFAFVPCFINVGKMWHQKYIYLIFAFEVLGIILLAITLIRYIFEKHPLPNKIYKQTIPVFRILTIYFLIVSIAEIIAGVIYISNNKPDIIVGFIIYFLLKTMSVVSDVFYRRFFRLKKWIHEIPVTDDEISHEGQTQN